MLDCEKDYKVNSQGDTIGVLEIRGHWVALDIFSRGRCFWGSKLKLRTKGEKGPAMWRAGEKLSK